MKRFGLFASRLAQVRSQLGFYATVLKGLSAFRDALAGHPGSWEIKILNRQVVSSVKLETGFVPAFSGRQIFTPRCVSG